MRTTSSRTARTGATARTPAEPTGTTTRRTRSRPPLSRVRILDEAEGLLAAEGATAFSMRRLADRLGVTPMALYTWFRDRDELLASLSARTMAGFELPVATSGPWAERAYRLAAAIRAHVIEHRVTMQAAGSSEGITAAMLAAADRGLELLLELGYGDQDAVDHYRALFWHVMSLALAVDVAGLGPPADASGEPATDEAAATDKAPATEPGGDCSAPNATLRRLRPLFAAFDRDALFERSTRLLLAAIEAGAPRSTTTSTSTRATRRGGRR